MVFPFFRQMVLGLIIFITSLIASAQEVRPARSQKELKQRIEADREFRRNKQRAFSYNIHTVVARGDNKPMVRGFIQQIGDSSIYISELLKTDFGLDIPREIPYHTITKMKIANRNGKRNGVLIGSLLGGVIGAAVGTANTGNDFTNELFEPIVGGLVGGSTGAILGSLIGGVKVTLPFDNQTKSKSIARLKQYRFKL